MKIKTNDLLNAVAALVTVSVNNQIEENNNIFFIIKDKALELRSTNLNTGIRIFLQVESAGNDTEFSVEAKILYEIVKRLKSEYTELNAAKTNLEIKSGNTSVKCKLMAKASLDIDKIFPADDSSILKPVTITVDRKDLLKGLEKAFKYYATNSTKPALENINFCKKDNFMCINATDGFRLIRTKVKATAKEDYDFCLPGSEMKNIIKYADSEKLVFSVYSKHAIISTETKKVYMKMYTEKFMDIDNIIQIRADVKSRVGMKCSELADVIDMIISINNTGNEKIIPVKFECKDDMVTVSSKCNDNSIKNEFKSEIEGSDISINLNPRFIKDCLSVMDNDDFTIEFVSTEKPAFIEDGSTLQMILPVRA
jgi:DNA polymerase III sliding clamp (beta) subunit (PCNA family)